MSVIGEAILSVSIELLLIKLASEGLRLFAHQEQIHTDLKKWEKLLSKIHAVLDDAEERQMTEQSVKIWLGHLQNLAYDVEDILDEFATEALRRKLLVKPDRPSTSKAWKLIPTCCTNFNPQSIMFSVKMKSKLKEISTRLQDLAIEKDQLDLKNNSGGGSKKVKQRLPTTSLVNEAKVYGREKDKELIVELLLKHDLMNDDGVSVLPIVGMGGVGKTTLAQLVYNDVRVKGHFDLKVWVCVSEDFDIIRITKTILQDVSTEAIYDNDLNSLQVKLKEQLLQKKFLLVLDDIWNENPSYWNVLRCPFEVGSRGSKIIVTTRNQDVSLLMGTLPAYPLKELSDDDCLRVFTQNSLGRTDFNMHQQLKEIGGKIVKKCNGLPLAAETLGGILHGKVDPNDWEDVLNNKIWDLPAERSSIIPALKVSYHFLPPHLKQCFAYCSIFPKDYEFQEEKIILLWMAQGFLQNDTNEKQMENLGRKYFRELHSRSFFQQSSSNISQFVMHDLINDLAQWAVQDICFRMDDALEVGKQQKFSKNLRHLSYIIGRLDGIKRFEDFCNVKHLRTFLAIVSKDTWNYKYLSQNVLFHILPKLQYLRSLSLCGYAIFELPSEIGDLKHLRYLDLSYTRIKALPESISALFNLQTLMLENCIHLRKLFADIGNLVNLHHLNIYHALALQALPVRMGKLICLQRLSNFVVGKGIGSGLKELKSLTNLSGRLCILRLENVNDARDAREANLHNKRNLNVLSLEWSYSFDDSRDAAMETNVLDMLQPHQNLKELIIKGYSGTEFPTWMRDSSVSSLVLLRLENCCKCTSLPPVGQLPFLKELVIEGMNGVKSVGPEFFGTGCSKPFPSLETLYFGNMQEWKDYIPAESSQEVEGFPHLRELSILDCSKLLGLLPEHLPSLEKLVIKGCEQLSVSIGRLPTLCKLEIDNCKEVVWGSTVDLSSMNSLVLSNNSSNLFLLEGSMKGLSKLEELRIDGCEELTYLWQSETEFLTDISSLRKLVIENCPQLLSLVVMEEEEPQQKGLPCRLEYIELSDCECLVKLPQALHRLSSLTKIFVAGCKNLVSFPEISLPSQLKFIDIRNCDALEFLPEAWTHNRNASLQSLSIHGCDLLTYIARVQLPPILKRLEIICCMNLQTLVKEEELSILHEENHSLLEYLHILDCPSLTSLWSKSELPATLEQMKLEYCFNLASLTSRGNLPKALKDLQLFECSMLETVAESLYNNTFLESILIDSCENLKCLPSDLHKLSHLHNIQILNCPALVSFPEGGLPSTNLKAVSIQSCEKLEALPYGIHKLTSLDALMITHCTEIVAIPESGFPTNLRMLTITNVKICKSLFKWGLHRLYSLKQLRIDGECLDVMSFPQEEIGMILPTCLTSLRIIDFPNLEYISSTVLNLTSLEELSLNNCPKLQSFPENGLPISLLRLHIAKCPLLKQRCQKGKRTYWPMISPIPEVRIDGEFIFAPGEEED